MADRPQSVHAALLYDENIPFEYFEEFRKVANECDLDIHEESHETTVSAALEWAIPTLIIVYVGKKFIDAFVERAADDFADSAYPRFKKALSNLAIRAFRRELSKFKLLTPNGAERLPHAQILSICSETRLNRRVKFVFRDQLTELQYEESIEQMFATLREHHGVRHDEDTLSRALSDSGVPPIEVYMVYNAETAAWLVVDKVSEARIHPKASDGTDK